MALGGGLGRQVQIGLEGAERRLGGEKPGFQARGAVSWHRPGSAQLLCSGLGELLSLRSTLLMSGEPR